jgi:hypothetical protein
MLIVASVFVKLVGDLLSPSNIRFRPQLIGPLSTGRAKSGLARNDMVARHKATPGNPTFAKLSVEALLLGTRLWSCVTRIRQGQLPSFVHNRAILELRICTVIHFYCSLKENASPKSHASAIQTLGGGREAGPRQAARGREFGAEVAARARSSRISANLGSSNKQKH